VLAVDWSADMLEPLRAVAGVTTVVADMTSLPAPTASFVLVAVMVMHGDADLNLPIQGRASRLHTEQIRSARSGHGRLVRLERLRQRADGKGGRQRIVPDLVMRRQASRAAPGHRRQSHLARAQAPTRDTRRRVDASLVIAEFFRSPKREADMSSVSATGP
jgi:hypothetical protein